MKPSLVRTLVIAMGGTIVVALIVLLKWTPELRGQLQEFENSSSAFLIMSQGTKPMLVELRVLDLAGNPVSGVDIDVRNNSGGNKSVSDANGHASIMVGETDVAQILLAGQTVLDRPNASALGYPNVKRGLRVLILRK